ncbi:MAG: hypothetical protein M3362_25315 [Acidobacteriota bacterium]|nr:hypothetical protein [Acidobacteriota bacterium]
MSAKLSQPSDNLARPSESFHHASANLFHGRDNLSVPWDKLHGAWDNLYKLPDKLSQASVNLSGAGDKFAGDYAEFSRAADNLYGHAEILLAQPNLKSAPATFSTRVCHNPNVSAFHLSPDDIKTGAIPKGLRLPLS